MTFRAVSILAATIVQVGFSSLAAAVPVACGGGALDFTATSDTPFTLPMFNVGQNVTLTAVTTGFTAADFAWSVPGPHIKDYNEDLGTKSGPSVAPIPWSTTSLAAADFSSQRISFFWRPSAAQTHPLNGPPESRVVSLTVTATGGASCTNSQTFLIERNASDPEKQPEDFYTSNHRAPTTTNPGFGRVLDEHIYWHQFVGGGPAGNWQQFLPWHTAFLSRFDQWRLEFGYPTVVAWYPGRPMPTGVPFNHAASLRLPIFDPDDNRIPTYYTLAGGSALDFGGQDQLGDYVDLDALSDSFEGSYHGQVHCNIGPATGGFFDTSGPGFGSMCRASSPKDPLFWRWHGFIDVLYRNFCQLKSIACLALNAPPSDPWMSDNAADISANGSPPSPSPHWLSPDTWNRTAPVSTDACVPRDPPPELNTVGGITRDCGSEADHENPVAGSTNFLYATLRNDRPGATRTTYAEVAVYIANAATGLAWPTDFKILPESRQFITLHLEPGQVTDIGPLPWVPPAPSPSDHWCIYLRVVSVQETPPMETANVDANVADSNSIAWRNLKIVNAGQRRMSMAFVVRNIQPEDEQLALQFDTAPELLRQGRLVARLDATLQRAMEAGGARLEGIEVIQPGTLGVTSSRARISGLRMRSREQGVVTMELEGVRTALGDILVTQSSTRGNDGGVVLRVAGQVTRTPTAPIGRRRTER